MTDASYQDGYSPEVLARLQRLGYEVDEGYEAWWTPEGRGITRRHALNLSYAERAHKALEAATEVPDDDGRPCPLGRALEIVRLSDVAVMAELGRSGSPPEIVAAAQALWEAWQDGGVATQGEALAWLRARRRSLPPAEVGSLACAIEAAIDRYALHHSGTSAQMIAEALRCAALTYKQE
jgi:hypothetical protein